MGVGGRRHRHVGAGTRTQRCRASGRRPVGPGRRALGDRGPRRPAPGTGLGRAGTVRRRHPHSRPTRRRHQRAAAARRIRFPLCLRSGLVPCPQGGGDRLGIRCASFGTRIWPTTSTGQPTSWNSTGRPDRCPDAEPGARRPPVSRVPEGTRRLAPTCRLAGGCTTRCLLRRSPLLGGLACRSPLGRPLRRSPLLGGLACRSPLGRPFRRSPLLGGLPCRSPLLGGLAHCRTLRRLLRRSPLLGGLACRSPLGCLLRRSPLLRSLRAGARFTDFRAGARFTAFFAVVRFAAFFAGARFFAAFLAGALLFAATATGAPP